MVRKIIQIDEEKCIGCGACVDACHEGAIEMVNGKAKLLRDDYCDGLGNCLPACPADAIIVTQREASAYDQAAVKVNKSTPLPYSCPGTHSKTIVQEEAVSAAAAPAASRLSQWPVQISLVPVNAPYFHGANLLIAADCTAYAYGDFHEKFIKNHITLIGCPKLDQENYADKLTAIIRDNDIKSVTIARMEVPCCGGLENTVKTALKNSGKFIPWQVAVISTDGTILDC